jgi:pyridoxamine 5'-phosphate oxidase
MALNSRTDYTRGALDVTDLGRGPWSLLESWVNEAVEAGIQDPTAFTLSTLDASGCPHGRIVLLRGTRDEELVFFTNYGSEKGQDVERTGRAGATFFWPHAERQIRVRGTIHRISEEESDAYFASRPRASQLGAWSSTQSQPANSRSSLDEAFQAMEIRFEGQDVPRPSHWGGYALVPSEMEFWQGRASRMHDRIRCRRTDEGGWELTRLQP